MMYYDVFTDFQRDEGKTKRNLKIRSIKRKRLSISNEHFVKYLGDLQLFVRNFYGRICEATSLIYSNTKIVSIFNISESIALVLDASLFPSPQGNDSCHCFRSTRGLI